MVLFLFIMCLSMHCHAFELDSNRWTWVQSDDKIGVFYDSVNIEYSDQRYAGVWVCIYSAVQDEYYLNYTLFDKYDNFSKIYKAIIYDSNGDYICGIIYNDPEKIPLVDGSEMSFVKNRVFANEVE